MTEIMRELLLFFSLKEHLEASHHPQCTRLTDDWITDIRGSLNPLAMWQYTKFGGPAVPNHDAHSYQLLLAHQTEREEVVDLKAASRKKGTCTVLMLTIFFFWNGHANKWMDLKAGQRMEYHFMTISYYVDKPSYHNLWSLCKIKFYQRS